jgi:hypothetical protein
VRHRQRFLELEEKTKRAKERWWWLEVVEVGVDVLEVVEVV